MTESVTEKSVRMPSFDGSQKNFQVWWKRFEAYAEVYKFSEALVIGGEKDLPTSASEAIDETTAEGKLKAAAKKRNTIAMANLTMAFTSESTIGLIYKAETADWPRGLAHLVVKALFEKYQPKDTISKVELRQQMNRIKMKKDEDPAKLFEQISQIENKYNSATYRIPTDELIAVVLDAAPIQYQAVLTVEQ
jgi:hypothetical protein